MPASFPHFILLLSQSGGIGGFLFWKAEIKIHFYISKKWKLAAFIRLETIPNESCICLCFGLVKKRGRGVGIICNCGRPASTGRGPSTAPPAARGVAGCSHCQCPQGGHGVPEPERHFDLFVLMTKLLFVLTDEIGTPLLFHQTIPWAMGGGRYNKIPSTTFSPYRSMSPFYTHLSMDPFSFFFEPLR